MTKEELIKAMLDGEEVKLKDGNLISYNETEGYFVLNNSNQININTANFINAKIYEPPLTFEMVKNQAIMGKSLLISQRGKRIYSQLILGFDRKGRYLITDGSDGLGCTSFSELDLSHCNCKIETPKECVAPAVPPYHSRGK